MVSKLNIVSNMASVKDIMDRVPFHNLDAREIVYLGSLLQEFKRTDIYTILSMNSIQTIQALISSGQTDGQNSERNMGKLQGIQMFLDDIDILIQRGESAKKQMNIDQELKRDQDIQTGEPYPIVPGTKKRRK
jgi:hypothetical protein